MFIDIEENIKRIKKELPKEVMVLAATKERSIEEIEQVIKAGIEIVGENYVQEAQKKFLQLGKKVKWHFIGHLQTNKVKKALEIFDCIQSVDSLKLAQILERQAKNKEKEIPILIELNIAKEKAKFGPGEDIIWGLAEQINKLPHLRLEGLMTMEPYSDNAEDSRVYFRRLKEIFDQLKKDTRFAQMRILSMGMSRTYQVAVQEGANLIRLGEAIFGPRDK